MSRCSEAGEVRPPEKADFSLDSGHRNAPALPRRIRDGMCGTPYKVTQDISMRAGVASRLRVSISVSEICLEAFGEVGADHSSDDMRDSITRKEQRVRTLEMLGMTGIGSGSVLHHGGIR